MRHLTSWISGMIVILTLAAVFAPSPAITVAQNEPNIAVSPASGVPGTRFAFMATGFSDDEDIGVWVNTPTGEPMVIQPEELFGANGDGRADWYWTSPTDAVPGIWQMIARGVDSKLERMISFEIIAGQPIPPTTDPSESNVDPEVGPPGTRFAFAATGFGDNELIGVWVNTPAGQPMEIKPEALYGANSDGRADWYWTSPADAPIGTWQMVARGVDSDVQRIILFEIR